MVIKKFLYLIFHTILFTMFFGIVSTYFYGELTDFQVFTLAVIGFVEAQIKWHTM